jgi:PAS domain S-box-containing protein
MNGDGGAPFEVTAAERPPAHAPLALIYDVVSDPIMLLEPEGDDFRIVSSNAALVATLGMPRDQIVGTLLGALNPDGEKPSRFGNACRRAFRERVAIRYEEHTLFRGKRISALITLTPIFDGDGECRQVLSVSRDITHETQVIDALRASEHNLEATLRSIGDAVITTDNSGRIMRMNPQAELTTGFTLADARGRALHEVFRVIDAKSRASLRSPAFDVLRDGIVIDVGGDALLLARGGVERAVSASAAPIRDVGGHMSGVVVIYRDVTPERRAAAEKRAVEAERRRTETALRESEARYRTQFEHAPEAIVTFDVDAGRFVEANGNALRLFGYSRDELMKIGPLEVTPPTQPDGRFSWEVIAEYVARAIGGETPTLEGTIIDKSARELPCEIRLVRLPGAGMLVRASVIDITERKVAAALLEQNRLIQAANRMKSEFVANMSHELRTPLNAILGFAELMVDGKLGHVSLEQKDALADVLASGRHLLSLINGMLDLAKVESGRMEIAPERVDLRVVVAEVTDVLRALAARKRIKLGAHVDASLAEVVVDPARLKQVLFNYVSNALKFTPENGAVMVRALPDGDDAFVVHVEDTGIGIEPRDLDKLFLEFSQLDAGMTKRHEGTGLGLALTKRIVEALGGRVAVASTPGKGSTFSARLPRAPRTLVALGEPLVTR